MSNFIPILEAVEIVNNSVSNFIGTRKYLTTGGLNSDYYEIVDVTYDSKPSRANLEVEIGYLVVARMQNTNKVLLIDDSTQNLIVSTGFLTLKPKPNFSGQFLKHFLSSDYFQREKDRNCVGATQRAITNQGFSNIKIPSLSYRDQLQYSDLLDKSILLIKNRKETIKLTDEFLRSTFLEMFGDPILDNRSWGKQKLGKITHLITDGKHGDCRNDYNSGYYFLSAKDIYNLKVDYSNARQILKEDFEEVHRRTDLKPGDLLLVNTGATIGKVAVLPEDDRVRRTTLQKSVAVIKPNSSIINVEYLKYSFLIALKEMIKSSSGSAQKNLLLSEIRKIDLAIPPIDLQNEFAEIVKKKDALIQYLTKSVKESENLFNSLMQKVFRGEL